MLARVLQQDSSTTVEVDGRPIGATICFLAVGPSCQLLEEQLCHGPCHSHGRLVATIRIILHSCVAAAAAAREADAT